MVKVTCSYGSGKATVTYEGKEYGAYVKMETDTRIAITPDMDCTVTLFFNYEKGLSGKNIVLDGKKCSLDNNNYSFEATAGTTYKLTKGDAMWLFLVVFTPKPSEEETLQGDVDGNGKVEQADADLLVKILLEQEKATEGANVDGSEDKDINVADLTKLIEILKKEEVTFPQPKDDDDVEFD